MIKKNYLFPDDDAKNGKSMGCGISLCTYFDNITGKLFQGNKPYVRK